MIVGESCLERGWARSIWRDIRRQPCRDWVYPTLKIQCRQHSASSQLSHASISCTDSATLSCALAIPIQRSPTCPRPTPRAKSDDGTSLRCDVLSNDRPSLIGHQMGRKLIAARRRISFSVPGNRWVGRCRGCRHGSFLQHVSGSGVWVAARAAPVTVNCSQTHARPIEKSCRYAAGRLTPLPLARLERRKSR